MTLDKLKVAARQHEQRDEWRAAIELYRQAIHDAESGAEGGDPSVFNRIGDLEHKTGDDVAACEAWEQAATRYAEQGFFNNAIALGGKILRLDPTRVRTYLELARFQARKRVIYDVSHNLRAYLGQMNALGRVDVARASLETIASEFSSWSPMQDLVDELLGRARATEPAPSVGRASTPVERGLVFLDTAPLTLERASDPMDDLGQATGVADGLDLEGAANTVPLADLEPTASSRADIEGHSVASVDGLVDIERTSREAGTTAPIEGLSSVQVDGADTANADGAAAMEGLEATSFEAPEAGTVSGAEPTGASAELVFIDTESEAPPAPRAEAPSGEPVHEADPDDPIGMRVMAQALLEHGDRAGGISALERALELHSEREEWSPALQVASELIQAEPLAIHRYQARVEMAARMQDSVRLCEAYAELGDALLREGSKEKAIAVFRRVLELDDQHAHARAALRAMAPERETPAGDDGFIDFGALVNDDVGPRSTRMRTETTAISPDEDETFKEALAEFKRALDQNLGIEEHQAHYDLGIAFREMGLMDEAVSEFQKALRSPESRMRASEALGQLFFEQGRAGVAEAVLRGVDRGPEGDADKIGVLYWLGRALEAQGKNALAQGCYDRVLAVDVSFLDAADRTTRLGAEHDA